MMGVFQLSNYQWEVEDDSQNQQQQSQGNGLRAQLERALSEVKELKAANATLGKQAREASISSLIQAKGLNPKIAKLIPADVESTREALDTWFEENSDLFPAAAPKEGQGEQPEVQVEEDPEQEMMADAMDRMANVANSGRIPGRQEDVLSKLNDPSLTQEKLLQMIAAAGGGIGSG